MGYGVLQYGNETERSETKILRQNLQGRHGDRTTSWNASSSFRTIEEERQQAHSPHNKKVNLANFLDTLAEQMTVETREMRLSTAVPALH